MGPHSSRTREEWDPVTKRKPRFTLIKKVEPKTAQCVSDAIIELLSPFVWQVHKLTSDNGKEFADHRNIAGKLSADCYFAHSYASWERGLNENTNGLIRQYFPGGSDFTTITQKEINQTMDKLNNRPRKYLGMKTPNPVFSTSTHRLHLRVESAKQQSKHGTHLRLD